MKIGFLAIKNANPIGTVIKPPNPTIASIFSFLKIFPASFALLQETNIKQISNNKLIFQINNKRLFSVLIEDIISI